LPSPLRIAVFRMIDKMELLKRETLFVAACRDPTACES
jgi:hypothetical protein